MRKILKFLLYLSMTLVLAFISLVVIAFLGDYKPDEKTLVYSADQADVVPVWAEIDILTWNIGYGGLSKDMDFFL
jgi:hypothetical protein